MMAVWQSGRAVWSVDLSLGGEPYFEGWVDVSSIDRAISELRESGVFDDFDFMFGAYNIMCSLSNMRGPEFITIASGSDVLFTFSEHRLPCTFDEDFCSTWTLVRETLVGLLPRESSQVGRIPFTLPPLWEPPSEANAERPEE